MKIPVSIGPKGDFSKIFDRTGKILTGLKFFFLLLLPFLEIGAIFVILRKEGNLEVVIV